MVEAVSPYTQQLEAERLSSLRSFDVLASVDMLRFDLQVYGEILPPTAQRVLDEELTYMAEGINRPLRTEFTLPEEDGEPVYFNKGKWRPYIGMLMTGFETAKREAIADPRKNFLAVKAAGDLQIGYSLRKMQPGDTLAWESEFPEVACEQYGEGYITSFGFQPKRRMGFLYHATKNEDNSLTLVSQSVDNSDERAFTQAWIIGESGGNMDAMLAAYDMTMMQLHGVNHYAGRRLGADSIENAWTALQRHKDLHGHYMEQLVDLASQTDMPRPDLELAKKRLTYGVWAALKARLDHEAFTGGRVQMSDTVSARDMDREIYWAYRSAIQLGEVLAGCGGVLSEEELETALLAASPEDVLRAIFGEDDATPRKLRCTECHRESPREQVVQVKSWRCPHCTYEVDVCTGKPIHPADLERAHGTLLAEVAAILAEVSIAEAL